jgi:hypothetical protein
MLSWQESLEHNIVLTGTESYRAKCNESHPKHEAWRAEMIRMATEPPIQYPPISTQIKNAIGATGRAIAAVATGKPVLVPDSVYQEREAKCVANRCGQYDAAQRRCFLCGCKTQAKLRAAQEECPSPMKLWSKYEPDEGNP